MKIFETKMTSRNTEKGIMCGGRLKRMKTEKDRERKGHGSYRKQRKRGRREE